MNQDDLRSKIEDLVATARARNHTFGAWAIEFIESMEEKLGDQPIRVTSNQETKIVELWEQI